MVSGARITTEATSTPRTRVKAPCALPATLPPSRFVAEMTSEPFIDRPATRASHLRNDGQASEALRVLADDLGFAQRRNAFRAVTQLIQYFVVVLADQRRRAARPPLHAGVSERHRGKW